MAFNYRKLFENLTIVIPGSPTYCCSLGCRVCSLPPPLIPPPSSPSIEDQISRTHHDSYLLTIIGAVSGSTLLLVIFSAFFLKYWSGRNRSRAPPPQSDETHEDFLDEDHGPVMEHPIWFITTVGLQESVINSITVCKYKRGEGLVEGTDCSVCLSEFEEDETLRLLPKCSHAFHLPCIDTWLRSHTNCPLCRAPIVSNTAAPPLTATTEPILDPSGTGDETQVENSVICNRSGEGGVSERRVGTEDEDELQVEDGRREIDIEKEEVSSSHENWGLRVVSDSAENRPEGEDEMQPMRRSVSMDSFSASMLCFSLANLLPMEPEGSSATQLVRAKKSNSGIVAKRGSGNPSIFKLMGSSFTGRSLQRGPISMKRSFSCGGKFLLPRKGRSQSSILPL